MAILVASVTSVALAAGINAEVLGQPASDVADRTGQTIGAQRLDVGNCADLADLQLANIAIGSSTTVFAGGGGGVGGGTIRAFCRVAAVARPTPASRINFEIWLPSPRV